MATARAKDIELPTQAQDSQAPGEPDAAGNPPADPFVAETEAAGATSALAPAADDGWGNDVLLAVVMILLVLLALAATRILRLTEALRTVHDDELAALGEAREMRRRLNAADEHRAELEASHQKQLSKQEEAGERERDELLRTNRLLQGMVRCDTLTGLANGPYFARQLAKELRRAMRTRRPLSLLVCDVDAFSGYNRSHGHEAGDELLQRIGAILAARFQRGGDLAARLDGDRFVVAMPDTPRDDVVQLAAKLRNAVEQAAIPHGASPVGATVTLSVGLAAATSNKLLHPHQLLAEAIEALDQNRRAAAAERAAAAKPARKTRRKTATRKRAPAKAGASRKTATRTAAARKTATRTAAAKKTATPSETPAASETPSQAATPTAAASKGATPTAAESQAATPTAAASTTAAPTAPASQAATPTPTGSQAATPTTAGKKTATRAAAAKKTATGRKTSATGRKAAGATANTARAAAKTTAAGGATRKRAPAKAAASRRAAPSKPAAKPLPAPAEEEAGVSGSLFPEQAAGNS